MSGTDLTKCIELLQRALAKSFNGNEKLQIFIITDDPVAPVFPHKKNRDPRIGPHKGKEAELLLNGSKPVAMIYKHDCKDFDLLYEAVQRGQLVAGGIDYKESHYFCQPGKERDMEELINIYREAQRSLMLCMPDNLHKRIGEILGYSDDEIHAFLEQDREQNLKISTPQDPSP